MELFARFSVAVQLATVIVLTISMAAISRIADLPGLCTMRPTSAVAWRELASTREKCPACCAAATATICLPRAAYRAR